MKTELEKLTNQIMGKKWEDSFLWCPSQCYLYFSWDNVKYCIYLRWRHNDPWTAELIRMNEKSNDITDGEWMYLDVPFRHDIEFELLKKDAIQKTIEKLLN
jgi:hypothetical protein